MLAALLLAGLPPPCARGQQVEPPVAPPPVRAGEAPGWALTLFPVAFYTTETRWGVGGGGWLVDHDNGDNEPGLPDTLWLSLVYTQERQTILWVIPELYFHQGRSRLLVDLQYRKYPTRYFGIGNDAPPDVYERYTPLVGRAQAQFTTRLASRLALGPYVDYQRVRLVRTEPGGALAGGTVPGSGGSTVAGAGPLLRWDSRDDKFQPTAGGLAELAKVWYRAPDDEPFRFSRLHLDLRGYVSPGAGHVLAGRALAQSVSGEAPFTALPELGGRFLFRGVFEGRYRDARLFAAQGEYRFPLAGRWRGVLFGAFGAVAPTTEALRHATVHSAGGAGLRYAYNAQDRINVRLDVAAAQDSTGIYLSVGEAF